MMAIDILEKGEIRTHRKDDLPILLAIRRSDYMLTDGTFSTEFYEMLEEYEHKLDEVLDINGWDLKKALRQFAKGNATLFEWSESPIVYRTTEEWARIKEVSKQYFSEKGAVYHYYGIANSTLQDYLLEDTVRYKKYFYAIRPLLAARYIEDYHTAPPVLFDDLLKMDLPKDLRQAIEELLNVKKRTTEGEENPQMPVIKEFIEAETARQKKIADDLEDDHNKDYAALNCVFVDTITSGKEHS